jgi:hypothetical protein
MAACTGAVADVGANRGEGFSGFLENVRGAALQIL